MAWEAFGQSLFPSQIFAMVGFRGGGGGEKKQDALSEILIGKTNPNSSLMGGGRWERERCYLLGRLTGKH